MIALKNLQNLNDLLTQAEVMRAVALHYTDMVKDKEATVVLKEIIATSEKCHKDMLTYITSHK